MEEFSPLNFKSLEIDKIIQKLLNDDPRKKNFALSQDEVISLCYTVRSIIMTQPNLLELKPPINVCGDFHGQYDDLRKMFQTIGYPENQQNYLFLGDYVDRGKKSLECISLLLAYKIKYRKNFFLLRGNHECSEVNRIYGFYDQCKRRSTVKAWKVFAHCFKCLPLAATIGGRIFCVHGGLSPMLNHISQINRIKRPSEMERNTIISDLLWSDPSELTGWNDNIERGIAYTFGPDVIDKFLAKYDFDLICRSHQVIEDGYEFGKDRKILTIFSAPNYCGKFENLAAVLIIEEDMKCHIKQMAQEVVEREKDKRKLTPCPKNLSSELGMNEKEKERSEKKKKRHTLEPGNLRQIQNLEKEGRRASNFIRM